MDGSTRQEGNNAATAAPLHTRNFILFADHKRLMIENWYAESFGGRELNYMWSLIRQEHKEWSSVGQLPSTLLLRLAAPTPPSPLASHSLSCSPGVDRWFYKRLRIVGLLSYRFPLHCSSARDQQCSKIPTMTLCTDWIDRALPQRSS